MRLLPAALFAAIFASTAAAHAQPSPTSPAMEDARCLLEMAALTNSKDPNAQHLGQEGVIYFTGRVAARDPNFDFARLKPLAATLNAQSAQTDLQQRCGPMFNKSMQQLEAALAPPAAGATPPPAPPASPPRR